MREKVHDISAKLAERMREEQDALGDDERMRKEQDELGDELILSEKKQVKPCESNAAILIERSPEYSTLHFDDFLSRQRLGERDWSDSDDLELVLWLQQTQRVAGFNLTHARNAARAVAFKRRLDSLRQFVDHLPPWDGIERIDHAFAEVWGAPDTPLTGAASRNYFNALIARALHPGCQVDTLWVFEGAQGVGKSRSMRALGGKFHAEITAPIGTTDFMRELLGVWLAELSELDSLRGREASTVKRLLSAPTDRFVQKFELHAKSYPRRAVAIATTNEAAYWQDSTGARRLIPVACGDIRVDLVEANRLQWFAEAKAALADGATWWQFPDAIAEHQEERQQPDAWEDMLRALMQHGKPAGFDPGGQRIFQPWPSGWVSSADIMREWLGLPPAQQPQTASVRLGKVMRRLGFIPRKRRDERGWEPPAVTDGAEAVDGSPAVDTQHGVEF